MRDRNPVILRGPSHDVVRKDPAVLRDRNPVILNMTCLIKAVSLCLCLKISRSDDRELYRLFTVLQFQKEMDIDLQVYLAATPPLAGKDR